MVKNKKSTGRAMSMPGGLAMGVGIGMVWTLAAAIVLAKMIDNEIIKEASIGYGAVVILITASFIAAFIACKRIKRQRAMVCGLAACLYYCILLAITALFFGGQYTGMGVTGLVILAGSTAAMFLGKGEGSGRKRKGHKIPHP